MREDMTTADAEQTKPVDAKAEHIKPRLQLPGPGDRRTPHSSHRQKNALYQYDNCTLGKRKAKEKKE